MRNRFYLFLLLGFFVLCVAGAFTDTARGQRPPSQQQRQQSPQDLDTEVVTTRLVNLPITVLDKKDQPVTGLTRNDFLVFEDKRPQQINSFFEERESPQTLYIGVLMDTSSSTAGKLRFEKEAALNFIHTVARRRRDQIAFVTFDDEVKLLQDFTTKLDLLDKAIEGVKKPGRQTALYNAIWQFCNEKMRNVPGRRALVVITDGDDTVGQATLREAIEMAQATETTIYAISTKAGFLGTVPGVEAGQVADKGDRNLERLCEETGGRAFFTGDILALERSFTRVAKELHTQYIITYIPTNKNYDGRERRIEVKLAGNRDGLRVRTKRGYIAFPDSAQKTRS